MAALLGGSITLTVLYWGWLDSQRLSGVAIAAELFFAIASFGMVLQISQKTKDIKEPVMFIVKQFLIYLGQIITFIGFFFGGVWGLLRLTTFYFEPLIGPEFTELLFIILFVSYVGVWTPILMWLSDKELIGQ